MSSDLRTRRTTVIAGSVAAGLLPIVVWWAWFAGPPQLGADEKVFDAVDALFTAVRARDPRLLEDCEQRLRACEREGKLSASAIGYLDAVIETARAGNWRPAAQKLYKFMKAQRRYSTSRSPTPQNCRDNASPATCRSVHRQTATPPLRRYNRTNTF